MDFDPISLARRQRERDRDQTKAQKGLFEHKMGRMEISPLAFLRGAAPLFYEMLERYPKLAEGPDGEGWIVGDLHLENFGAFKPCSHFEDGENATFDLNDFDDCTIGPLRFDLLRLTTSLILGGRELGCNGRTSLAMCRELITSYAAHVTSKKPLPNVPRVVRALIKQASLRSREELLNARTTLVKGKRAFVRGPRYQSLKSDVLREVPKAFAQYVESLDPKERPKKDHLEIVDAAFRVAGTGSLGCLRIAVLVTGKGGSTGHWIFDMKEEGEPSSSHLITPPKMGGAGRVRSGMHACLTSPPTLIGTTKIKGLPMLVRRLTPQEDKLDLTHMKVEELVEVARYLGALVGRAHKKGMTKSPKKPWKEPDFVTIVDRAILLAGMHEAVYLALCNSTI